MSATCSTNGPWSRNKATRFIDANRVALAAPARLEIVRGHRRAVGEPGTLAQRDCPRAPVGVQTPRRGKRRAHPSQAINGDQRFVELAEQQALAVVRRARCVCGIDGVRQANDRNGVTSRGDERAVIGLNRRWLGPGINRWNRNDRRGRACAARRDRLNADDAPEGGEFSDPVHAFCP